MVFIVLAAGSVFAQTPPKYPTQHIYMVPQHNLHDSAFIADSLYANGNHDSAISIVYKIYRNDTLIDTVSKYGWAYLKLRQMGTEYVSGNFDYGTFLFPEAIPFAGMVAHSFTISVLNAEPGCNRNRVPMLYMHFDSPGRYKVVMEIYSQKNYKIDYIGTMACGRYKDGYCLDGSRRAVWSKDSVSFVVHPSKIHYDTAAICQGDSYLWRGKVYTTSGNYKDEFVNLDGTDSVYQLTLTVYPTVTQLKKANICSGETYYWRGKYYTKAGVYKDSVINKNGCKDRYTLELQVRSHFLQTDTQWCCANSSFRWRGRTISTAGLHTWTYNNPVAHCDSVYQLRVFHYPVYSFKDTVTICSGSSYVWHGQSCTQAGTYQKKYLTSKGCDSVYQLTLLIDDGFLRTDVVNVCRTNGYTWRGRLLQASGTYYDSLKNRFGCDSVYCLKLTLNRSYYTEFADTACGGQNYVWKGHAVSVGVRPTGTHTIWDSLKTVAGCDSVFRLRLTVYPSYRDERSVTICDNEVYVWKGHSVTIGKKSPGTYTYWDSLKSVHGCDSIFKLVLNVLPSYYFEVRDNACDNGVYVWKGHSVTIGRRDAGTYVFMDSLKTKSGCDSVYKLTLTVNRTYYSVRLAEVCAGEAYVWKGHAVQIGQLPAGNYVFWDSLKTVHGCDSVYKLDLKVKPVYSTAQKADVCENEAYVWKGHSVAIGSNAPGTYIYWDSLKTSAGCDSVFKLELAVHPVRLYADTSEICAGGSLAWRGRRLTEAGVYDDSLKTVHGCDSIFRKVLVVHPSYLFEEIVPICNNDVHVWRGRQLVKPGVYSDSLKSVWGCDSVYRLVLRVNPVYLIDDTLDGCENGTYSWRGRSLVKAGVYMDSLKAQMGCDSVFRLLFRLHPVTVHTDTVSVCAHNGYRWHGRKYGISGLYADTLQDVWGCDSICRLLLDVHPDYVSRDTMEICSGKQLVWRGKPYSREGFYADSLLSVYGCDSVFTLSLKVNPTYLFNDSVSICSHESYAWRGRVLTADGVYYDSLQTARGCDSVFRLRLNVRTSYFYYDTVEICSGSYHMWRGKVLSRDGSYVDSLMTLENCPEVHRLRLVVNPSYLFRDTADICSGNGYMWHGRQLDRGGIYYDSLKTVMGCDSVYVLNLRENPVYLYAEKADVCHPQTCFWRGRKFTESGVYDDTLHTYKGCDSIFRLQLTVHPSYLAEEVRNVCGSGPVEWRGRKLYASGVYTDSLKTISGCDSVFRISLQLSPSYYFEEKSLEICGNEGYMWHGRLLDRSGVYFDSLKTIHGCDSVYRLQLTINPVFVKADTADLCDGGSYLWRGRLLSASGRYADSLKTLHGCDSVYSLLLRVHFVQTTNDFAEICEGESYVWNGRVLTRQGRYIDTLRSGFGCDSIVRFFLYTYPMFNRTDTVSHCQSGPYFWRGRQLAANGVYTDSFKTVYGCDSVYCLYLTIGSPFFREEVAEACGSAPYLWRGRQLTGSGVYHDSLKTVKGCDSVYRLNLTMHPYYRFADSVHICSQESYLWRGRKLTATGIYYDSLKTIHGCDSVYCMALTVCPTHLLADSATICSGDAYAWRGRKLTVAGIYYDSLKSRWGCDSVYRLRLSVLSTYMSVERKEICQGQDLLWRGKRYAATGTYIDSMKSMFGCDSVFRLELNVWPVYYYTDSQEICNGGTVIWRGRKLSVTGDYYDSLKSVHGCDSVYHFGLKVHPVHLFADTVSICSQETYSWRGRLLAASGLYHDSLKTREGCDSVYTLQLTVNPKYYAEESREICQGQSVLWRGKRFVSTGVYSDSLKSMHGCDSVFRLKLTVWPVYLSTDTQAVCQGEMVSWRGRRLTVAGDYYDSLKSVHGCDSVFAFRLIVYPRYLVEERKELCQGGSVQWRGKLYSSTGIYTDSLKSVHGCDSVFRLDLKVWPVFASLDTQEICQGGFLNWRGRKLAATGEYYDSLKTAHGCDSVYRLSLMVRPAYLFTDSEAICNGDAFAWRGRKLVVSGVYHDSLKSMYGCDSVYRLVLKVHPKYLMEERKGFCHGQSLLWRGKPYSSTGVYTDSLKTVNGCDSVFRLHLTVWPVYLSTDSQEVCNGDAVMWRGRKLTASGMYYDSLKTVHGCDSVFAFRLTVYPKYLAEEKEELCQGQSMQWRGKRYSSTGVYTDSLKSIHGCDSVFRLNLTVWPVFVSIDTQEICNGEMLMWRGRRLTASGSYYDSLRTVHGCDSVFRLLLNVRPVYRVADTVRVCAGERVKWHGGEYTQSGTYSDTLKTQFGCDSVCTLWLQVRPVYLFTDTASVCADALPYKWHGRELAAEGVYYDSLKTANGCDSVYLLSLVSNPLYFESFTDTVCEGTAYNRYGFDLPADSTVGSPFRQWVDSLKTVNGCDSVVCLNLYIRRLPKEMHPISGDTLISVEGTYMYYTDTIPGITAYEWSVSPSSIHQTSVAGKVWLDLDKNAMGWDTLTLVGHHACGVTAPRSLVIHVVVGLPVSQASRVEGLRVFPNPANDDVCIELSDYESWQSPEWVLCDAQGRRIASGKVDGVQTHIRLDDCPRGIYFVSLLSAGSRKTSIKVVKY